MAPHDVFREVPVLPVVVPGAAALFGVLLWRLRHRDRLSAPRAAVALVLCVYAGGVVANTVFPIFLERPAGSAPWTDYVIVRPLVGYELADAVMNVLVFVPLGMLVPLVLTRPSFMRAVAVSALVSLTIEIVQLVASYRLGAGHVADVNDLLFNVVGGALGCGLLVALARVPGAAGVIDRFRWRRDPQTVRARGRSAR